ncbi:hypothetical protein MY11210_006933 [Beauveria gryllotalpidicola]
MAVAAGTQALIATFAFGLVALASTSTACLFTFGNRRLRGNAPLRNGLRLVLVTFLLSAALWSIMDFAATLITADANLPCQILVSVAAGFDQLARIAFEQFLLLRIKSKSISKSIYVLQALIPVRFILAGVLIAVQRPQTYPVCIAKNILLPLGITTLVTDAVIVCVFFVLIWIKTRSNSTSSVQNSNLAPAKIVCFLTAGFAAWLATSFPMLFGLEIFSVASRTVVPSVGLLILIGLVALFRRHVLITDSDSQFSPSKVDTFKALPSRPTENRDTVMSQEVFNRPWGGRPPHIAQAQRPGTGPLPMPKAGSRGVNNALPIINRPAPGQTERGVGGIPVQGQLFPPTRANTAPVVLQNPPKKRPKGKLVISNPIIRQSSALKIQDKIATVDLALAAKNDKQRRDAASGAVSLDRAGQPQSLTRNHQGASLKRKQIGSASAVPTISSERSILLPKSATTATQLSPGEDELRRRSPRPPRKISRIVLSPPLRSPKRPSGSAWQQSDDAPPTIPPQSPLRRSAPVNSILRHTSGIFIDSGRPPAIPMNFRRDDNNWPDSSPAAVTPGSINESHNDSVSISADGAPSKAAGTGPKTALSESTELGGRTSMEPESAYNNRRQSSPVLPVKEMPQFSNDNARVSRPSSARSVTSTASQHNDEEEIVPMVLDTGPKGSFSGPSFQRNSLAQPAGWHHRLGDALPTFSDRKDGGKSPRRTLVPAPLELGKSSKPTRIVESQASPLESPQHALDVIQQQLKELDEADSETGVEDRQRRRLLENLEAEMGAQETHWQDIRRNLADRSPSSTISSLSLVPSGDLHLRSPRPSPALRSQNPADLDLPLIGRGADPVSAPRKHTLLTPADEKSDPPLSELTRRSNSGFTEQGSAQDISAGVENRAKFGKSASRNKDGLPPVTMTNDISTHRQLTNNPTSPESDEFEQQVETDEQLDSASAKLNNYSAWTQPGSEKAPLPVSHWSIDSDTTALLASESLQEIAQDPGNPAKTVASNLYVIGDAGATQSPQRIDQVIVSPTTSSPTLLHQESLLSPAVSEQTQSPRRPVTQKPPRRSKRITLLPDILESPQPLDKRGTLGIFQFPWGETSDIATLQPQLSSVYSVPLPGTTINELALAQGYYSSQVPSLPSQVYPASFFDHYSDDDLPAADSDGSTGGYSDDEDEAFDETTLWEIANLLRSSAIPSRNSLFPGSEEDRPPSRAGFTSADETTISAVRHLPIADLEDSTLGSEDKDLPPLPLLDTSVWEPKAMYTIATRSAGLAQPDEKTWERYLGKQAKTLRSAPRKSEPASITSTSLWALKPKQSNVVTNAAANGLWRPTAEAFITPSSTAPSTPFLASPLPTGSSISDMIAPARVNTQSHEPWMPSAPVAVVSLDLQDEQEWSRYTVNKITSSRPKPSPSAQDAIRSTSLWASSRPATNAPAPARKPASSTQPLWSKPAALPAEQTKGLWNDSHIRHQYRTTDQRPAVLYTARKLRIDRCPLPALRSASLWSTTTQTPARQVPDWLALSTTLRPIFPGDASSSEQDQDDAASASFDSYSLHSEVTAASSVATSKQSAAHRKTASKQAAQQELDAAFRDVMQAGKPVVAMSVAVPEEEGAKQDKGELEE